MRLPDWSGRTVACIATGPSLTREQVALVESAAAAQHSTLRVLAINDAGLPEREPFVVNACDIWYAPDNRFWAHHREQIAKRQAVRVGAQIQSVKAGYVHAVVPQPEGGHAGIQALRLALDLGADLVLLLGFDCRAIGSRTNYFGRKPAELTYASPEAYELWVPRYRKIQVPSGQRVLNCTPGSAIDAFKFAQLEEVLARQAA